MMLFQTHSVDCAKMNMAKAQTEQPDLKSILWEAANILRGSAVDRTDSATCSARAAVSCRVPFDIS